MRNLFRLSPYFWSGLIGLLAGIFVSVCFYFFYHSPSAVMTALRESDLNGASHYQFIDPLLGLKGASVSPPDFVSLQNKISFFIGSEVKKGNLITASVVVRDINRPASIYINDKEKYSPASLLKVPIMIAYFKMAETDPSILKKQIFYSGQMDQNRKETIKSNVKLEQGMWYSVGELIERMIKYSDNNATTLLTQNLNTSDYQSFLNNLFNDLGIHEISITDDFLTIRDYNLFFRVLYNATYLTRSMSEKALNILSQTDFKNGISSGVDKGITISQKFGEFSLASPAGDIQVRELHNCGIIYYPQHPYMLCVMTKGNNFSNLEHVISNISTMVFNHMKDYYSN